ncbi:MAG: MFS transporter [SAR324 cluster bacterium]|nr:MFS transporter [SAR324 cluster bacterium]
MTAQAKIPLPSSRAAEAAPSAGARHTLFMGIFPTLTNRWTVLALLCFARITLGFQFQAPAAVAPMLMDDLGLNYGRLGVLIGIFLLPGVFLALPGGLIGDRLGDKPVVLTGLAMMVLGALLLAHSTSFTMALAGRLCSGTGNVLLNVQFTKITTDWFAGREIATAMALLLTTWPLGLAISLTFLGAAATTMGWQGAITLTAAYALLGLLLVALLYGGTPAGQARPLQKQPLQKQRLWQITRGELALAIAAGLVWMLYNDSFIVFLSFAPALLISGGATVAVAGFVVALASWISQGSVPLGGVLTDRTGRFNTFILAGTLVCALAIWWLPLGGPALAGVIVLGVAFGAPPGAIMALPSQVLRPASRGTGLGVFYTTFYVGTAVLLPVAGYLQDRTGSADTSLVFAGLLMLLAAGALLVFRLLQRRLAAGRPESDRT